MPATLGTAPRSASQCDEVGANAGNSGASKLVDSEPAITGGEECKLKPHVESEPPARQFERKGLGVYSVRRA
jgi:hypothetical protein